ncbi:MAG: diadenylate cyclase CdaA, partial [Bacteroidales bacterium]|nr:diadenylate cyclase CdaA [Bacteroidales bacterium]
MPIMMHLRDIIDIFLVAVLLFGTFNLMKSSGALSIFAGVLSFVALWILVSYVFEMRLMGAIMDKFVSVGAIALIILFQSEIRRFLVMLGSRKRWRMMGHFFSQKKGVKEDSEPWIMQIVLACQELSKKKTGALIVLENATYLDEYVHSGELLDANISGQLIQNIFFKNSPLHDGAVIISNFRIKAAACILPVAHDENLPKEMGLRHRAALGITQTTDAKAIVVSEETGKISLAYMGEI